MPDSLTTIEAYAFDDCINLTTITFQGSQAEWIALVGDTYLGIKSDVNIVFTK